MKVKELIEKLQTKDPELIVMIEYKGPEGIALFEVEGAFNECAFFKHHKHLSVYFSDELADDVELPKNYITIV